MMLMAQKHSPPMVRGLVIAAATVLSLAATSFAEAGSWTIRYSDGMAGETPYQSSIVDSKFTN